MDALVAAGAAAAGPGATIRVVLVPTAVARHRPDLAVTHGRRAFEAAGARAGLPVRIDAVPVLDRSSAEDPASVVLLEAAHVIHLPGGDPDLLPAVLRGTGAWAAVLRAHAGGACVAGASAGAMALGGRLWTRDGPVDGLGLVPGIAVIPHFDPGRAGAWRRSVDPAGRLAWLGLDERTLVIGRPGEPWLIAGAGRAHVLAPSGSRGVEPTVSGGSGERLAIG